MGWVIVLLPFAYLYLQVRSFQSGDRRYSNGPDVGAPYSDGIHG